MKESVDRGSNGTDGGREENKGEKRVEESGKGMGVTHRLVDGGFIKDSAL